MMPIGIHWPSKRFRKLRKLIIKMVIKKPLKTPFPFVFNFALLFITNISFVFISLWLYIFGFTFMERSSSYSMSLFKINDYLQYNLRVCLMNDL